MDQIVDYLESGQERVKFPDRFAKQIRNHPYLTQLDGEGMFDMQQQQENAWKQQEKEHIVKEMAEKGTQSAPEIRATMSRSSSSQDGSSQTQSKATRGQETQTDAKRAVDQGTDPTTQFFDISEDIRKKTEDERMREEQKKANVRKQVEHNLGENPGTIPFIETRASSSQGYSSMYIPGPRISIEHRLTGEQAYTSKVTQGPRFTMEQNLKREQGYTSQTTQGPRVEHNLRKEQYYTSETTQGPRFTMEQNLRREQGYTSKTTAKAPVRRRIRIKRRDIDQPMPDPNEGQNAPKREPSAHPEAPGSKKGPGQNAPKMDPSSSSSGPAASSSSGPAASSSSGPAASSSGPAASSSSGPAASSSSGPAASAAKKGDKKDAVKKDTVKQPIPPRPAHATDADKNNTLKYWERQNKTKLVDQITKDRKSVV